MMTEQKTSKRQIILISAGLVLLILIAFEPLRYAEFINYDDDVYVTENRHIQSGITYDSVIWAFTSGYGANWHPLTWLSHMVDIELFGLNHIGHLLHNLLLHAVSTVLLFLVLQSMTCAVWRSAFVAMVFGIHPLHVESVAWIAERKDVLSGLFWMLTIAAYLYYVKRGGIIRYLSVILCFALGLMAKPMLVTLPIVLLILDFWPLHRLRSGEVGRVQKSPPGNHNRSVDEHYRPVSIRHLFIEKLPLLLLAIASCTITYQAQQHGGSVSVIVPLSFRISNALTSYVCYLDKIFWPRHLAVLYPLPTQLSLWGTVAAASILILWSGFVTVRFFKQPYLAAGWLWYGVMLVPVIGLIQVGSQSMADRYSYLPSIGIFLIISWGAAQLSAKWRHQKVILGILSGLAATVMIVGTRNQSAYWKDSVTLLEHTLTITQNNYRIHYNLGLALLKQNKVNEAIQQLDKSLQVWPDFPRANLCMAVILINRNQLDQAMNHLHRALKLKPDNAAVYYNMGIIFQTRKKIDDAISAYEQAVRLDQNFSDAFNNLGVLKNQKGMLDEAVECFRQSLRSNPDRAETHNNLASVLQAQNRMEEAVAHYHTALQIDPNNYQTYFSLAFILEKTGKLREVVDCYRQMLRLKPNSATALNNLAWILATTPNTQTQNFTEVISLAQKACELTSFKDPEMLDTLAAAYAANGRFKEAMETVQKAIGLAMTAGQIDIAGKMKERLYLYQTSKPYYDIPAKK